jgi:hypothetical protein
MENWKQIENSYYEVSNEGRIRRKLKDKRTITKYGEYKYLKLINHKGHNTDYYEISLGRNKKYLVHRLVAQYFLKKIPGKEYVNHKNGNGHDNRVENLEWCTISENNIHASKNNLNNPNYKKRKIYCVELQKEFESSYDAAMYINEKKYCNSKRIKSLASNIRSCGKGLRNKAYGYRWTYK